MSKWFEVDKAGLAKLMAGRSKAFVVFELLQNAWDQNVTSVDVRIEAVPGTRNARIAVTDDDPEGFADLRDAYTLFAESRKKGNTSKRGRFNLGEKLVLALAKSASITTTTGTVEFSEDGERRNRRAKRESGSEFQAVIPMTKVEIEEAIAATETLIAPRDIKTTVNGKLLTNRTPLASFAVPLPTVVADEEGVLRKTVRKTEVRVYQTRPGETASLYEMGIPVVETGDRFHVDIWQKVPLNMDRDNVPPSYLKAVRVAVLNSIYDIIHEEDTTQTWVREACGDKEADPNAVKRVLNLRFGGHAVRYDPSDLEANNRSAAAGRPVVHGGSLTAGEWENATLAGVLPPAGQVTPSDKPYSKNGKPLNVIPQSKWTYGMRTFADYAIRMGKELLDCEITVRIVEEPDWWYAATYSEENVLTVNVSCCGERFFDKRANDEVNKLLLHEFAHHYESNHLSEDYYDAITDLGARLTRLALNKPELFR